jgi:hypothetical protein
MERCIQASKQCALLFGPVQQPTKRWAKSGPWPVRDAHERPSGCASGAGFGPAYQTRPQRSLVSIGRALLAWIRAKTLVLVEWSVTQPGCSPAPSQFWDIFLTPTFDISLLGTKLQSLVSVGKKTNSIFLSTSKDLVVPRSVCTWFVQSRARSGIYQNFILLDSSFASFILYSWAWPF